MYDIAYICHSQYHDEVCQQHRAVFRNNGADQAGNADGGQLDDEVHDFQEHFIEAFYHLTGKDAFFPSQQDAEAHKQGNDNNLKHGSLSHGLHKVGGEDIHDGIHDALGFCGGIRSAGGVQHNEQAFGQGCQNQCQCYGKSGGAHVINQCFATDGAYTANVLHGDDAGRNGEHNNGHDDEFQQVQENGTPGLDISLRKVNAGHAEQICVHQQQTCCDTDDQTNEDPESQRHFFLLARQCKHSFSICIFFSLNFYPFLIIKIQENLDKDF